MSQIVELIQIIRLVSSEFTGCWFELVVTPGIAFFLTIKHFLTVKHCWLYVMLQCYSS